MRFSHTRSNAMTLLEVLLAISIATMLLGAIGKFAFDMAAARSRLAVEATRASCAEAIFTALDRAMETAVVEDAEQSSGIVGSESSLCVRSNALQLPTPGVGSERAPGCTATQVRFVGGRVTLDLGRGATELDAPVRAFRLRYLLRDGWRDAFDSRVDGGFPVAIEASLWFAPTADRDSSEHLSAAPDRTRLFRTPDAPTIDPLAVLEAREPAKEVDPIGEEE